LKSSCRLYLRWVHGQDATFVALAARSIKEPIFEEVRVRERLWFDAYGVAKFYQSGFVSFTVKRTVGRSGASTASASDTYRGREKSTSVHKNIRERHECYRLNTAVKSTIAEAWIVESRFCRKIRHTQFLKGAVNIVLKTYERRCDCHSGIRRQLHPQRQGGWQRGRTLSLSF
jgi:hypothetical protein